MNMRWKGISCSNPYVRQTGCYLKDWMSTSGLSEHCAAFSWTAACVVAHLRIVEVSFRCRNENMCLMVKVRYSSADCSSTCTTASLWVSSTKNWNAWTAMFRINTGVHSWQVGAAVAGSCTHSFGSFIRATFQGIFTFFLLPFSFLVSVIFCTCFSRSWMLLICVHPQIMFWQLSLKAQVSITLLHHAQEL